MDESACKNVSSRGLLKSCTIHSKNPISSVAHLIDYPDTIKNKYNPGDSIYICTTALTHFINRILPTLTIPFVLVTGDCDIEIPTQLFPESTFNNFISNPLIIHWFCQNWTGNHHKVSHIPIGLDYHTMTTSTVWGDSIPPSIQEKQLNIISENSHPFWKRKNKCYSNFHFSIRGYYVKNRKDAIDQIPKDLIFYEPSSLTREDTWLNQTNYAFIVSPHGNGLDCHRTWEALCLGSIPIVTRSKIDHLFDDLPVLIINKWSDITQKLLDDTIAEFKNRTFNYDKLTLKYYTDLIRSKRIISPTPIPPPPTHILPYTCSINICTFNNQQGLPPVIKNIKTLINLFTDTKVNFFYDKSTDDTLQILQNFQKEYPHCVDIIINTTPRSSSRTTNIAHARNQLLQHTLTKYPEHQYIIMMDTNEYSCVGEINTDTILKVFTPNNIHKWDAVSFDREAGYYDTWALSFDNFIYSFFHFQNSKSVVEKMREEFNELLSSYKLYIPNEFIPVYSAFNGFAIYKTHKFTGCSYSSTIDPSIFPTDSISNQIKYCNSNILPYLENDCEHRHFHLQAIQKNNAIINIFPQSIFKKVPHPPPNLRGPC